ncbi:MAG: radical SAM protein [Tannerellaceae bacterium]|nr:radical SAM protein [Tannerellaceae bacterium]
MFTAYEQHFTGPIWRPPYEAQSILLQATAGCSHNKCKFCSLYPKELKFRASPMEEIEYDLRVIKQYRVQSRRVFLTGSNPFVLRPDHLMDIAQRIRVAFPHIETIGCFARITDIKSKTVEELKQLRHFKFNRLTIGIESGHDETLRYMRKGYDPKTALEQCLKLEEAGIEYHFIILNGLAGEGKGVENAMATAELFNQIHPSIIGVTSMTIFPESDLYEDVLCGRYIETPEKERLVELKTLIENLKNPTTILANTISNAIPITGILPKDRNYMLRTLQSVMDEIDEEVMSSFRKSIGHL